MVTNRERWEEAFGASPRRDATFTTMSGIPLDPVYGPADGEFPGEYPYTRGPYASMYRSKLWTMRMFAGFGTADDTNWRFKEIIKAGGDGLSTAFDMPTLLGIDSDHPMALGEVGRCGVAIDTLADMEDLYSGIDLGAITTSMTINSPAAVVFAMFVAQATNTHLSTAQEVQLLLVLLLTSKGAAGVTGSGFIVLASTLSAMQMIPLEGLALLLGVDRFMSEARAITNIIGNGVATLVISRSENAFDDAKHAAALAEPMAGAP